jgi:hypothetical protein
MTNSLRIVGLAGALVVVLATSSPALSVAQPNNAVAERQPVVTELGTNASAITYWVSESDGWHVVTTVDIAFAQEGDAEKHAVVRFSSLLLPGQSQLISVSRCPRQAAAGPVDPSPRQSDPGGAGPRSLTAKPRAGIPNIAPS